MVNLPSQELAEIVATLRAAGPAPGSGSEQRRASRIEVRAPVVVWALVNGSCAPAHTVLTRDISGGGLGLLQSTAAAPAQLFVVGLPRPRAEPLLVLCRSTFCAELADGLFSIGAEFVQLLGERRNKTDASAAPAVATAATAA